MLPEEKDSKADSSAVGKEGIDSKDASSASKTPDVESLVAENKRKGEKIQNLEKELSSFKDRLDELEDISENRNLTRSEKGELSDLEADRKKAAKKLRELEDSQPWIHIAGEEGEAKAALAVQDYEIRRANDYLVKQARKDGVSVDELAKKLSPFYENDPNLTRESRNELAYERYQDHLKDENSVKNELKKLREERDAELRFRETGSRLPRNTQKDEAWDNADSPLKRQALLVDLMNSNPAPVD